MKSIDSGRCTLTRRVSSWSEVRTPLRAVTEGARLIKVLLMAIVLLPVTMAMMLVLMICQLGLVWKERGE